MIAAYRSGWTEQDAVAKKEEEGAEADMHIEDNDNVMLLERLSTSPPPSAGLQPVHRIREEPGDAKPHPNQKFYLYTVTYPVASASHAPEEQRAAEYRVLYNEALKYLPFLVRGGPSTYVKLPDIDNMSLQTASCTPHSFKATTRLDPLSCKRRLSARSSTPSATSPKWCTRSATSLSRSLFTAAPSLAIRLACANLLEWTPTATRTMKRA